MQIARPRTPMGQLWSSIPSWLFPMLEDEIGELDLSACGTHRQAGCAVGSRWAGCPRRRPSRAPSTLFEEHGGRHVRVRAPAKIAAHLAFGLVVIAAGQMFKMLV